jgi:hypothetical protein
MPRRRRFVRGSVFAERARAMVDTNDDEVMAASIRRGGQAWVIQALALAAIPAAWFGAVFTGMWWLSLLTPIAMIVAGGAMLVARRTILPNWTWSFLLSWVVEDPLQHQRVMAWLVGAPLIGAGLLWGVTMTLVAFAR